LNQYGNLKPRSGSGLIKVCGMTQMDQVLYLDQLGVDFIGFIFVPGSPRAVKPEKVAEVRNNLKNAKTVGVVKNPSLSDLHLWASSAKIDYWQFHGAESPDFMDQSGLPYFQVIGMSPEGIPQRQVHPHASYYLYDTQVGMSSGGLGKIFNWAELKKINSTRPIFLAGGLNPDNVEQAILEAAPQGVDLNSGVEDSPGVKNLEKVQMAVEKARSAWIKLPT